MKKLYCILLFIVVALCANAQILFDNYPSGVQTRSSFNGGKWPYKNLKYYFENGPRSLDKATAHDAVREAFNMWEERSTLTFTEVSSYNNADIRVS